MGEETFDKLHKQTGGTLTTGPSQEAIVGADASAASAAEGNVAVGGAAPASPVPLPRLSSFCVYYDQSDKTLKIFEPQVCGPKGTIVCGLPGSIGNGTYYCNVLKQKTSGTYIAKIESTDANADSGYEKVCSVKLFTLNGMDFKQFHAGAITVPGGGESGNIKSVSGKNGIEVDNINGPDVVVKSTCVKTIGCNANADGVSQVEAADNHVAIVGDRWCGLEVIPNQHGELRVQLVGRDSIAGTDPFRIRKFIGSAPGGLEGSETLFLGSADIEIPTAKKYVAGNDTNIVFTEKKDSEGNATGEIAVDVYYK